MTLTEFREQYCTGSEYDSCANSPCLYSNHSAGCTHPMHPKNIKQYQLLFCPICRNGADHTHLFTRDMLRRHLERFHRRIDVDDLLILANDVMARHQWIMRCVAQRHQQEVASCGQ